jgi:AraC-like DNA-binding protein
MLAVAPSELQTLRFTIEEHLLEGPTLRKVARVTGTCPRTLQRHLANHGVTYRTIVGQVRMQVACKLLEARKLSVTEVALELGYTNTSAFFRAFKRWIGMPPRRYRTRLNYIHTQMTGSSR